MLRFLTEVFDESTNGLSQAYSLPGSEAQRLTWGAVHTRSHFLYGANILHLAKYSPGEFPQALLSQAAGLWGRLRDDMDIFIQ